jgi:hypothetical protein
MPVRVEAPERRRAPSGASFAMPKSSTLVTPARVRKNVLWLEIAMHEAGGAGRDQTPGDLDADAPGLRLAHLTAIEQLPQRFALEQFDHHERVAILHADVEHFHDVRVIERGGDAGLAEEPLRREPIRRADGQHHLQRDLAIETRVGRAIHDAHATARDQAVDAVRSDEVPGGRPASSTAMRAAVRTKAGVSRNPVTDSAVATSLSASAESSGDEALEVGTQPLTS